MREIYMDNAATTRVDEGSAAIAVEAMREAYGNPSSLHEKGAEAARVIEKARGQIAYALACETSEIYFTSGGTEANNLAIFGAVSAKARRGKTIVSTAVEHASVLEPLAFLEKQGCNVRLIPPLPDGSTDIGGILAAVDDDTILVSCMMVNSETGAVTPLDEISKGLRRKKSQALFHADAVQAFGKLSFSTASSGVDVMTASAHKIHAPKGCGALFIRKGCRILPHTHGGGQEKGLRPGTQSVPLIAAFGHAARAAAENLQARSEKVSDLRDYFIDKAKKTDGICINSPANATPYICNISVPGYRSEIILHYLGARGIFVSSGSACSGGAKSHVLTAMGLSPARVDSAIRISFCVENTTRDIDAFFECLDDARREIIRS